jgi:hypothetical protein
MQIRMPWEALRKDSDGPPAFFLFHGKYGLQTINKSPSRITSGLPKSIRKAVGAPGHRALASWACMHRSV